MQLQLQTQLDQTHMIAYLKIMKDSDQQTPSSSLLVMFAVVPF